MYSERLKRAALLTILGLALLPTTKVAAMDNKRDPQLPPECSSIEVPEGNKLIFHVYARGVQIYRWNGITLQWDFVAPVATLYAEPNFFGEVGTHYVGPTWESKSGSKVKAARVPGTGCTPDPSAIAWLLLAKVQTDGKGIFSKVTYIQRVNTTGGLTPTAPGSHDGEVKEVPYTAEYYFYRDHKPDDATTN